MPFLLQRKSRRAVALVLVLAFLVLISVLILAFFSTVSTDFQASQTYSDGVTVRHLAETANQIVIGQIVDGTKSYENPQQTGPGAVRLTWSSQPGLIRNWRSDPAPDGTRARVGRTYKLYSSRNMVEVPAEGAPPFDPIADLPVELEGQPDAWPGQPGLFTDLNAPVLVESPDGPIHGPSGGTFFAQYPIVDPLAVDRGAGGAGQIAGFQIKMSDGSLPPGYGGLPVIDESYNPTISPAADKTGNPAPMPVRWIYVLRNGRLTMPEAGADGVVTWTHLPEGDPRQPSRANPIVGRIAFWTDDETCKVNLNTAGEGVWWDRPWAEGTAERSLAEDIPRQNEFQRYAGHPATTSLSAVFGRLFPVPATAKTGDLAMSPYYGFNALSPSLAPRVNSPLDTERYSPTGAAAPRSSDPLRVRLRGDRLYTSVDELIFRAPAYGSTATEREFFAPSNVNGTFLERARFFLTASSRAPEVNVLGRPRVSLWPLQANTADPGHPELAPARNSKDRLIAFCTSISRTDPGSGRTVFPFYFQRYSTYDSGLSGHDSSRAPSCYRPQDDWTLGLPPGIPSRNQLLYEYLRREMTTALPGFGGRLSDKYPNDVDQLLASMYDVIRSGLNTQSTGEAPNYSYVPPRGDTLGPRSGEAQAVPFSFDQVPAPSLPGAAVLPFERHARGFGRFGTVTEAVIQFYCTKLRTGADGKPLVDTNGKVTPEKMRAIILLEPFNPAPGPPVWSSHVKYRLTYGPLRYTLSGQTTRDLPFLTNTSDGRVENLVDSRTGIQGGQSGSGGTTAFVGLQAGFRCWKSATEDQDKVVGSPDPRLGYPLITDEIDIPEGTTNFDFNGGDLTIELLHGYPDNTGADPLVQTIYTSFPPVTGLLLPSVASGDEAYMNYQARLKNPADPSNYDFFRDKLIRPGDVVRSVEATIDDPARGDLRFFSALGTLPPESTTLKKTPTAQYSWFQPLGGPRPRQIPPDGSDPARAYWDAYQNPANRILHDLRQTTWLTALQNQFYAQYQALPGAPALSGLQPVTANSGKLVAVSYNIQRYPAVPRGLTSANAAFGPGDWDNGPGFLEDGPFINKPDEGNQNSGVTSYYSRGVFSGETGASYAPNRQVASAVVFGSLPSGLGLSALLAGRNESSPWQTLLFTPFPAVGDNSWSIPGSSRTHPGARTRSRGLLVPPDHALLDLFTMPIVEPYAISEPFSTAGKVNLNYQIAPFHYLKRDTALRAALKPVRLFAVNNSQAQIYKTSSTTATSFRYDLELDETLRGFERRFQSTPPRPFITASEICEMPLVPKTSGVTLDNVAGWWAARQLTGDNARESPYQHLYPRLTTQSNTYTIHVKVQALRKTAPSRAQSPGEQNRAWAEWDEKRDRVLGEYRGSTTVERYVDPADPRLPDFANPTVTNALDEFYKIRIIAVKRFTP